MDLESSTTFLDAGISVKTGMFHFFEMRSWGLLLFNVEWENGELQRLSRQTVLFEQASFFGDPTLKCQREWKDMHPNNQCSERGKGFAGHHTPQ